LKPSLNEIISMAMQFSFDDPRREQIWSLIIKDKDWSNEIAARFLND